MIRFIAADWTPMPSYHGWCVPDEYGVTVRQIYKSLNEIGLMENRDYKIRGNRIEFENDEAFVFAKMLLL